jgi:hypothetical protein
MKDKKAVEVNNISDFEFWYNMFKHRTTKWQRETLKRLRAKQSIFETASERVDKIKALELLLDK